MISTTGGTVSDDKLYFEPRFQQPSTGNPSLSDQCAIALNKWQSWNAFTGGFYDDLDPNSGPGTNTRPGTGTGVQSLTYFESLYPNAKIVNADNELWGRKIRCWLRES
jgi:hypothetical protein